MASQLLQQGSDPEMQAVFRRYLPQRLKTLLLRTRAQCRGGWDCNVLRSLFDEVSRLAGACGRYGMLETGERLLALEAALEPAAAAGQVPDAAASASIDGLLDGLRPYLQTLPAQVQPAHTAAAHAAVALGPFPRCEVPPPDYWKRLGVPDIAPVSVAASAANQAPAAPPVAAVSPGPAPGPRIRIVNDDEPLINELVLRLVQAGHEVALVDHLDDLLGESPAGPPELAVAVVDAHTHLDVLGVALRAMRQGATQRTRLLLLLRGADVELRLRALRTGADRCVALPAAADAVLKTVLELAAIDQESPYRVLIVEDDEAQSLFAQAILRRAGMQTRILAQALPVLEELGRFEPDLLLLDLNLPDCNGFELVTLIRQREGYANTPIVFLSGELDEDRQFAALDAGADDFLLKPIRPTHLVCAVTSRIRRARAAHAASAQRQQRAVGTWFHQRSALLDALGQRLADGGGREARGGLLALEVHAADAMRGRLGAPALARVLAQLGEFVADRVGPAVWVARSGETGFLVFAPTHTENALWALAQGLQTAVGGQRFGDRALALRVDCAAYALGAGVDEVANVLARLARLLAVARTRPDGLACDCVIHANANALTERIAAALALGSFGLAFQPVIPMRGAAPAQFQALLRLAGDDREYRATELVPAAVGMGVVAKVDAWVVKRCVDILAQRGAENTVRLIASQSLAGWADPARVDLLRKHLAASAIDPAALVLEFRWEESSANRPALVALAAALRGLGVGVALAGVDRAASASGLLDQLDLDNVKLVPALAAAELAQLVDAAHARKLRVVAPCVETLAQVRQLRVAGVDLLQGNYFRTPAPSLEPVSAGRGG